MYIPAHFAETRPAALHDLMRAHPLATVVTMSSAGLVANHLPLHLVVGEDCGVVLQGHVARANPLWREDVSATETLADAPADYIERMLRAIVGIELVVTRLEGKWKMSQNQPVPNRAGVVAGLRVETGDEGRAVARMVAAAGGRD